MGKILLFLLGSIVSLAVWAGTPTPQTYSTVASGNWSSPSTWHGGQVPPTEFDNCEVIITHQVIYNMDEDLEIEKGELKIIGGGLRFPLTGNGSGRSIEIEQHGKLYMFNGELIMPITPSSSGNIEIEKGHVEIRNSLVSIAENWESSQDHVDLILSCIKIGENYEIEKGHLLVDRSCLEIGLQGSGNWSNEKGHVRVNSAWFLLRGQSGNFENSDNQSKITQPLNGDGQVGIFALDVPGNLENNGHWEATVKNYCVDGNIQGSRANEIDFMGPENCPMVNSLNCECGPQESPLPVTLLSFTGSAIGNVHKLNWRVTNEVDLKLYTIERSLDGRNFHPVGNVLANGSSSYQFSTDMVSPLTFYRLKMVDQDGSVEYSTMVRLSSQQKAVIEVSPNPFRNHVQINVQVKDNAVYQFRLVDMNGKLVSQKTEQLSRGTHSLRLNDLSRLGTGMYTLIVTENQTNSISSFKILKQD